MRFVLMLGAAIVGGCNGTTEVVGERGADGERGPRGLPGPPGAAATIGDLSLHMVEATIVVEPGEPHTGSVDAECADTETIISGGCRIFAPSDNAPHSIYASHPGVGSYDGAAVPRWVCVASPEPEPFELVAYAVCAQ